MPIIRHPGYSFGIAARDQMALMLGSWWALLPAALVLIGFIPRTLFEERTLRAGLPGYTEYTERVLSR